MIVVNHLVRQMGIGNGNQKDLFYLQFFWSADMEFYQARTGPQSELK